MTRTSLPINVLSSNLIISQFFLSARLCHSLLPFFSAPCIFPCSLFSSHFSFSLSVSVWVTLGMTAAPDRLWHDCTRCQLGVCCSSTPLLHTYLFYLSCSLCHQTVSVRGEWSDPFRHALVGHLWVKRVFHEDLVLLYGQGHTVKYYSYTLIIALIIHMWSKELSATCL